MEEAALHDPWAKAVLELVAKRMELGRGWPATIEAEFDGRGGLVRVRRHEKIDSNRLGEFDQASSSASRSST